MATERESAIDRIKKGFHDAMSAIPPNWLIAWFVFWGYAFGMVHLANIAMFLIGTVTALAILALLRSDVGGFVVTHLVNSIASDKMKKRAIAAAMLDLVAIFILAYHGAFFMAASLVIFQITLQLAMMRAFGMALHLEKVKEQADDIINKAKREIEEAIAKAAEENKK